jgi:hypothetical protein
MALNDDKHGISPSFVLNMDRKRQETVTGTKKGNGQIIPQIA